MPDYEIQASDGTTYQITAPDGVTQDQVLSYVQSQHKPAETPNFADRVGADWNKRAQDFSKIGQNGESVDEKGLQYVGNVAGAIGDLGANAIGSLARQARDYIVPQDTQKDIGNQARSLYDGSMLQDAAKYAGGQLNDFQQAHPRTSADIGAGLNIAGLVPFAKPAAGAAESAASLAGALPGKALDAVTPSIEPGLLQGVKLAQKYDVPLSLSQVANSPVIEAVGGGSAKLPFSGQNGLLKSQKQSITKALMSGLGSDSELATPQAAKKIYQGLQDQYESLGAGKTIDEDGLLKSIDDIQTNANTTSDALGNFKKTANNVLDNFDKSGNISGEKLNDLRNTVSAASRSADQATKPLLRQLHDSIVESMTGGDPQAMQAAKQLNSTYRQFKTVEPLLQKAQGGLINPKLLATRVAKNYGTDFTTGKAGLLGDLAHISNNVLAPASGIKGTVIDGAAAAALATHPAAASVLAPGLIANRAFQGLLRNPALIRRAIKKGGA